MQTLFSARVWRGLLVSVVLVIVCVRGTHSLAIEDSNQDPDTGLADRGEEARQFQSEPRHRLKMLFPLLLTIASRIAQVVPMAFAIMTATFGMVVLAKKAFLISMAAFGLMLYQTYKHKEKSIHYVVEPLHENHVINTQHIEVPPDHASSQWDRSSVEPQYLPPRNPVIPVRINDIRNIANGNYIQYQPPV
ncbi:uncharacterized protein [Periplaneta americana]|uniref:uncharacterized protein n=1 Tax=Periplaneta americana TaxID=6978 RepID=UPI0037E8675F